MSAKIVQVDGRYLLASSLPVWHKLVQPSDGMFTLEELAVESGQDRIHYMADFPIVNGIQDTRNIGVSETYTGTVIGYHSDSYNVWQPSTVWQHAERMRVAMGLPEKSYVTGGVLGDKGVPERLFVQFSTGDYKVPGTDVQILNYMLVVNSADGTLALTSALTSIASVCWNTVQAALRESTEKGASVSARNTRNRDANFEKRIEALPDIGDSIARYNAELRATSQMFARLAEKPLTPKIEQDFVEAMFPLRGTSAAPTKGVTENRDNLISAIHSSPGAIGKTLFDAYMGVTWQMKNAAPREGQDSVIVDLFGRGVNVRDNALNWLLRA